MITNSLSDFTSDSQKVAAYIRDRKKKETVYAYKSDDSRLPLKECRLKDVECVGGLWRIQDKFPYKIEIVRKKPFVIGAKLPYVEHTLFDFYEAFLVSENGYGKFIGKKPEYIVAKTVTSRGVFSAYGETREDARAYLGLKLYDEFQDIIHAEKNSQRQK